MASVKKTIDIIFAGVDNLSGTVNTVSGKMSSFGDQVGNVSEPLANITDSILKINAALLALGGAGLAYAYSKSIEFEDATVELQKVLGDQPDALAEAQKAAFDLSAQYGESSSDILMSTANFKQAGFEIQDSMILTKSAMDLSIAGSIGSAEASELLISTLKGFKAPASDAIRLVDILNEVSNNYATSARELGIGMADLSPIASLMGFSFEETAGILTPVIEVFRSGSEAAIALKTGLLRLIDDSKPVSEALEKIGVAQRDANGNLRSGKDILFDVATAFKTAEESDKLFLAAQLVGIQQAGRMVEVFNGLSKSIDVTNISMNSAGSAALEVAARLESGTVVVNRFKEGFANLAITVGDQFLEAGKKSINGATAIENSLQQIIKDGTFDPVFDALSEFSINIGKFLNDVAIAMPEAFENVDWSGLLEAFDSIGGKFGELFKDIDLTEPKELTKVIQFVIDSLESLVTTTEGIIGPIGIFIKTIVSWVENFNNLDAGSKKAAGSVLGWGKVVDTVIEPLQSLLRAVQALAIGVTALTSIKVASWVAELAGISAIVIPAGISTGIAAIGVSLGVGLGKAAEFAGEKVGDAFGVIEGKIKDITGMDIGSVVDKIFPPETSEILEGGEEKFVEMRRVIKEINDSLDDLERREPVDIKDMILSGEYTDTQIEFAITAETSGFDAAMRGLDVWIEEKPSIDIDTEKADKKIADTKQAIEEIPAEKLLEISLKGEIETEITEIKAMAETIQNSVEWTAKLNIAEAEGSAKMFVSIVESMANTITSTGDLLGDLFSMLAGEDLDTMTKWNIEDQIKEESEMRKDAHKSQMKLNKAQKDYMEARTDAIESGDGLINITADGLEPEIEAFLWKILEKIQIRANAESSEFLLGV